MSNKLYVVVTPKFSNALIGAVSALTLIGAGAVLYLQEQEIKALKQEIEHKELENKIFKDTLASIVREDQKGN